MVIKTEIRDWVIYKITNPNGNVYIGKTCALKSRISQYRTAGAALKKQRIIYNSVKKYGWSLHSFEIIDQFQSEFDFASGKEIFWIRTFMSNLNKFRDGFGMNLTDGGDGRSGYIVSEETKNKIGDAHRGKKMSLEQKKYLSAYNKRNPSKGMLGKSHAESSKMAMSVSKKGMVSSFKGKHHTEENKRLSSERQKGKPNYNRRGKGLWSDADKKRIGESKLGNTYNKGKKLSEQKKKELSAIAAKKRGRTVLQYDVDGIFLKEYPAVRVASKETGIGRSVIKNILKGGVTASSKYKFYYK